MTEAIRLRGYDAVRGWLCLLVLLHHAAITYGAEGGWFYKEPLQKTFSSDVLTFFVAVNQSYFMGLFFLLAGLFVPASLDKRGVAGFAAERLLRLGLPLVLFGFGLGPVTAALAATARGEAFWPTLSALWSALRFVPGPLWFALALLIFSGLYAVVASAWPRLLRPLTTFPSNTTLWAAVLVVGAAAFLIRLTFPIGWDIAGLQLGHFASYIALFILGVMAGGARLLDTIPEAQLRYWVRVALIALPILPIAYLFGPRLIGFTGNPLGGWNGMALLYAFWEPLVAMGAIMLWLSYAARHQNDASPLLQKLGERAFTVYVIHAPILVGVAVLARGIAAPQVLKFAVIGALAAAASYAVAGLVLRLPGARRVL